MLFSHRFGSVETLSLASYWLTRHGFEVVQADGPSHDAARITLNVDFSKISAAMALIVSIERSDPEGWPANTTPARTLLAHAAHPGECPECPTHVKAGTPIHWYPCEESNAADEVSIKVREYMLSRWE